MKLVVDTNVLMTYFWKNSETRKIILRNDNLELVSPEFALEEINKYREEIIRKAKIIDHDFKVSRIDLAIFIRFFPIEEYKEFMKKALMISPDPNDIDFLALALKLNLPLWSNDKKLKEQNVFKIYSTEELIKILE